MTKLFEKAAEAVRKLSSENQDEIARAMLNLADDAEPEAVDPVHLPAILEALAQAKAGKFASPSEVEAGFRRFDL
jgi:hypothetical protein